MADGLPAPLVPVEVDLRGLEWMPLLGDRLFGSATWIAASAEGKVAALRLWWRAYAHEVPAASLPDDDLLLADYAGYGAAVKVWRKVRAQALRGWVLCSDGRLYHPTLARLADDAWQQRLRARERQARYRNRNRGRDGNSAGDVTVTQPSRNGRSDGDVMPDLDLTGPDLTKTTLPTPDTDQGAWPSPARAFRERWEGSHDRKPTERPDNSAPGRVRRAQAERAEREGAAMAAVGVVIDHATGEPAA